MSEPIEGVGDGVAALQQLGKKILYVSNNSTRPDHDYLLQFNNSKIKAKIVGVQQISYI